VAHTRRWGLPCSVRGRDRALSRAGPTAVLHQERQRRRLCPSERLLRAPDCPSPLLSAQNSLHALSARAETRLRHPPKSAWHTACQRPPPRPPCSAPARCCTAPRQLRRLRRPPPRSHRRAAASLQGPRPFSTAVHRRTVTIHSVDDDAEVEAEGGGSRSSPVDSSRSSSLMPAHNDRGRRRARAAAWYSTPPPISRGASTSLCATSNFSGAPQALRVFATRLLRPAAARER
jgi:hypothetical protein